jgi:hypothetical protein
MALPLTSPVVSTVTTTTLFRLIAIGNAKVWVRFFQPFSSKWVMPRHTNG